MMKVKKTGKSVGGIPQVELVHEPDLPPATQAPNAINQRDVAYGLSCVRKHADTLLEFASCGLKIVSLAGAVFGVLAQAAQKSKGL